MIKGGSRSYIGPLTKGFADNIRLNSPVEKVIRTDNGVGIEVHGETHWFDDVIFACHSDQAMRMLGDISSTEQEILGDMAYQANEVVLHTDIGLLPNRKAAWAAWNYLLDGSQEEQERLPSLTYNMNILQHIQSEHTFCVTLNSTKKSTQIRFYAHSLTIILYLPRSLLPHSNVKTKSKANRVHGSVVLIGTTAFMKMVFVARLMLFKV